MIVPNEMRQVYDSARSFVEEAARRVAATLRPFCEKKGYLFSDRIKAIESVAEKIETGRYSGWNAIDDLYACCIVVPTIGHEKGVIAFLNKSFNKSVIKKRGGGSKAPETFRFDATRWVGQLKRPRGKRVPAGSSVSDVLFEVQVPTVFDFAWQKVSHAVTYKSNAAVDWRRYRLVAQLKAVVEQVDMLVAGFERATALVGSGQFAEIDERAKIQKGMGELLKAGVVPAELEPKDWSRFTENLLSFLRALEGQAGRRQLKRLDDALQVISDKARSYTSASFPRMMSLFQFACGAVVQSGVIGKVDGCEFHFPITTGMRDHFPLVGSLARPFNFGT